MKLTLRLITLLGAFAFAAPASAGWTGCYVGAHGGMAMGDFKAPDDQPGVPLFSIDGLSARGSVIGLGVGCDLQMQKFVFGIFGDYDWYNADGSFHVVGFNVSTVNLENAWTIGGRAGVLVSPTTLVYGLVGWTQADMNVSSVFGAASLTTDGVVVGGGIETELMKNLRLKLEYRYAMYDQVTAVLGPLVAVADPDVHTVRLGVSYAFTFGGSD